MIEMDANKQYFIICRDREQFKNFTNKKTNDLWLQGYTSFSLSNFIYVSGVDRLRGHSNPSGFFIGTWYERPDIRDILAVLLACCTDSKKVETIANMYDRVVEYENR